MPTATLATKLYIPTLPPKVVLRPRLIERLNEGLCQDKGFGQILTLISAPAGFGKTTLVSEWVPGCQRPVAWLSLDEGDNHLTRFLGYIIAALQTIVADFGTDLFNALQSAQPPPPESLLIPLLNEIAAIPTDFIFVLDDYHVIDSEAVNDILAYFIEHIPPRMHLVITTREDPALPISRLRARGQLTELRAADLRFTPAEAAEFLNRVMGLDLCEEDIAVLDNRTEGWIAGLQLAALSMRGHEDVSGFIRAFAGDHRYIVDYLVEEVLKRQSEPVRRFLLQTAILDRLNGPLCDAVTGQTGGKARLDALQRGNFFIVALDDRQHWYRYHHLFVEVLRVNLLAEQPDIVADLHRRASIWYQAHNAPAEAIRHALTGEDFARAAEMIECVFPEMTRSRQEVTLLGWLRALPNELVRQRPVLCNLYAGVLMQTGALDGVEQWLRAAGRWLEPGGSGERAGASSAEMLVTNHKEFRRLPAAVENHQAGLALLLGHAEETLLHARRALDLAPADDALGHGSAAALQGLAFWTMGDLESGQRMYAEGIVWLRQAGYLSDVMGCALALADIHLAQGHLREATRTYQRALQLATDQGTPIMRGTADMHVGLSEVYREQNELQAAAHSLTRAREQGEHTGLPQNRYRWRVALAGIRQAEGNLDGALELLDEAERVYTGDFSPNVRPIAAMKARVWAAQGRVGEALDWAHEKKLTDADDLSYLREFEHITLARILLACYKHEGEKPVIPAASALLGHLLEAAESGGRASSVLEILILQALLQHAQGNRNAALPPLQQALALAEPEGYARMFVDEGAPMEQLLLEASAQGIHPTYVGKLLAAFAVDHQRRFEDEAARLPAPRLPDLVTAEAQSGKNILVEPLSQRELEVLRLFRTELSGPEIARELMVALSTLRTHTKSIYSKLNVNSRRAAVKQAIDLHLI